MSRADDPMSGQHGRNTLKNFRPLAPTMSASHRLQHISTPNGSSASFAHIVATQWRADVADNRKTWAVVGTDVEAGFLYRDLVANAVADTSESSINRVSVILSTRAGDCVTYRCPGSFPAVVGACRSLTGATGYSMSRGKERFCRLYRIC